MSQAIGHGAKFQIESATPGTYTDVKGVTKVDIGGHKRDAIENTDMSTTGTDRIFLGGLRDPGEITVTMNYVPADASQLALFTADDGAAHNFKVIWPATVRTLTVAAIVTSLVEGLDDQKLPILTLKVKVTGPRVYV